MSIQSGNHYRHAVLALILISPWLLCSTATDAAGRGYWISGVEAVQAVQTPSGGIPLISGKPTFVHVYVQSDERGHGPWKNIKAELSVTGPNGGIRQGVSLDNRRLRSLQRVVTELAGTIALLSYSMTMRRCLTRRCRSGTCLFRDWRNGWQSSRRGQPRPRI